ncbi:MAG: DUF4242 domain-containing protein [Acidobacteriota bacterium]
MAEASEPVGRREKGAESEIDAIGMLKRLLLRSAADLDSDHQGNAMPQYVIERDVPNAGDLSQEELQELAGRSLDVLKDLGSEIRWLHSYVTDNRVYCVYIAPNEEVIKQHADAVGLPSNRISKIQNLLDPADYA